MAALTAVGISFTPVSAASPVPDARVALADVPLARTVSASSALPGYPVGNAADGNQATYWETPTTRSRSGSRPTSARPER